MVSSWKGLQPRLSPQVLTLREHPPARGLHGLPVPEGGASSQVHRAPRGPEGPAHTSPLDPGQGAAGRKKLEAEPPGSGITQAAPRLVGGPAHTIRRKRKEGGGRQEVKGALVLLSRGFVVKNWPQTCPGNSRASLGPPHPSVRHQLPARRMADFHTRPPRHLSFLPALSPPTPHSPAPRGPHHASSPKFFLRAHAKPSARAEKCKLSFQAPGKCRVCPRLALTAPAPHFRTRQPWSCVSKQLALHEHPETLHLSQEHG